MKIHTTQNLSSSGRTQSTNNVTIPNEEIRLNYSERMRMQKTHALADTYEGKVSFKGKKEIIKKVIDKANKAADKETRMDKFLKGRFFDRILDLMSHEVLVQACISAVICMLLRPLTIMTIPTKKNKQDNMYASAHSISSGAVGIISSLLIATPFSKGIKYAQKYLLKGMNESILKRKYPNLNIESIWADASKTVRKPVAEWKDKLGNQFSTEFKNTLTVARPKPLTEVSEETLKSFGANIDLNAMKNKPVSEWVDRNGKKLHLELKDMFIAVKEEGMGGSIKDYKDTNFFSLQHIDENFLKEVMPDLDIKSITKNGERVHTDFWKKTDGTPFNIDMDIIHVSSYRETANATPLYTGLKRTNDTKYLSFQSNNGLEAGGVPLKLGTPVDDKMLAADKANEISNKWLGWLPDIATRIPFAAGTILLIPWVLKHVFHLEKSKKHEEPQPKEINMNNKTLEQPQRKEVA